MILEIEELNDLSPARARAEGMAAMPAHLLWTQRAAAALRAHLVASDRADFRIFIPRDLDLHDFDE